MINASTFSTDALLAELLDWVRIESPTYDPSTANRMVDFIAPRIGALGFSIELVAGSRWLRRRLALSAPRPQQRAWHSHDCPCRHGASGRHARRAASCLGCAPGVGRRSARTMHCRCVIVIPVRGES